MRIHTSLAVVIAALTFCAAAGGYAAGRRVTVKPGDQALFLPDGWFCSNHRTRIDCQTGDAYPWVQLTGISCERPRPCGVTVKVHTLRDPQGGQLTRVYDKNGYPVYVFTAF